jgi:hypothetical protein
MVRLKGVRIKLKVSVAFGVGYIKPERVDWDLGFCELIVPSFNETRRETFLPLAVMETKRENRRERRETDNLCELLLNIFGRVAKVGSHTSENEKLQLP